MSPGELLRVTCHPAFLHRSFRPIRKRHLLIAVIDLDILQTVILQILLHKRGNAGDLFLVDISPECLPGAPPCGCLFIYLSVPRFIVFIAEMISVVMHPEVDKERLLT